MTNTLTIQQKTELLESETVKRYLEVVQGTNDSGPPAEVNEDDFS